MSFSRFRPFLALTVFPFARFVRLKSSSNKSATHLRERSLVTESNLCPAGRQFIKEYSVAPNGSKFSEVSYMAHSKQKYEGNHVVWCVYSLHVIFLNLIYYFLCCCEFPSYLTGWAATGFKMKFMQFLHKQEL